MEKKIHGDAAKQTAEKKIYKYLLDNSDHGHTLIPQKLMNLPVKWEVHGFMASMICHAFENMKDTKGESDWECDAKIAIGSKLTEKRVVTLNALRKMLLQCQGENLIEYSKEVGDEIRVRINISWLFSDIIA